MEGVGRPVRTDLASVWVVVNEFVKRRGNRGTMRDRAITVHTVGPWPPRGTIEPLRGPPTRVWRRFRTRGSA